MIDISTRVFGKWSRHQVYPTAMFMQTINHLMLVRSALRDLLHRLIHLALYQATQPRPLCNKSRKALRTNIK